MNYKLDPLKFGFVPAVLFPEFGDWFGDIPNGYVKISAIHDYGDNTCAFWYIYLKHSGFDDRIEIFSHAFNQNETWKQNFNIGPNVNFSGLISNDDFAKTLFEHLLGTTKNKSIKVEGKQRLISTLTEDFVESDKSMNKYKRYKKLKRILKKS